ncbi:Abc transporter c family member 2 [Globisporangium polare]
MAATKSGEAHYEALPPTPKQQQQQADDHDQQPKPTEKQRKNAALLAAYAQRGPLSTRENPLASASLWAFLSVSWLQPLVSLGARKVLEIEDLWPVAHEDSCDVLHAKFMTEYTRAIRQNSSSSSKKPRFSPIVTALTRAFRRDLTIVFANYVVYTLALALQSYIAQAILSFLNGRANSFGVQSGYVLVVMMSATSLLAVTCLNCGFFISQRLGANLRSVLMDVIYQKSLRLSSTARQGYSTGEIVTLMSVDAERAFACMSDGPWFFIAPFGFVLTIVLVAFLFNIWSALCGALLIVVIMWTSLRQAGQIGKLQGKLLYVVDERVKVTSEALQGIRVMKFYAWEESLARRVEKIRAVEVALYRKFHVLQIVNSTMLFLTPTLLSAVTLSVYVLIHGDVSVTDAFTLIAMVNICRHAVSVFPRAIATISQGRIAFDRIDAYLAGEELDLQAIDNDEDAGPKGTISVQDAHFQWSAPLVDADAVVVVSPGGDDDDDDNQEGSEQQQDSEASVVLSGAKNDFQTPRGFCLERVNLEIDPGELVMIVGTVGSGKSSLLNALLGEMKRTHGALAVNGTISYVSQESWIRNASVKENILFEAPFNQELYEQVLEAAQLAMDLDALPNGDQTEIGERGINMSGGQKARVAIARAMYRPSYDILILDDPLSAVDPHVAHAIFNQCVVGLAKRKTRLLVLNSHYDLLVHADRVVVVQDGRIAGDGSYEDVLAQFPDLRMQSEALEKLESDVIDEHDGQREDEEQHEAAITIATSASVDKRTLAAKDNKPAEPVHEGDTNSDPTKLVQAEDRVKGKVTGAIYKAYFDEAGLNGFVLLFLLMLLYAGSQGVRTLVDWWTGHWAKNMVRDGVDPSFSNLKFGMWYLGFIVLCCVLMFARGLLLVEACLRSSKNLHNELFRRVLAAPVNRYFDVTPVGRILNRFSNDLDQLDAALPQQYQATLQNVSQLLGALAVSSVSSYWIGVSYVPMFGVFLVVTLYFQQTSREVKRLEGVTRTPVYSLFGETLTGLHTIRAFKMQHAFVKLNKAAVDVNATAYFTYWAAGRWLAVRLDWMSVVIISVVALYLVATQGQISAVVGGISLTYSLMLTSIVQTTVRAVDKTDSAMTSVERLLHFRGIPKEEEEGDSSKSLVSVNRELWPSQGAIRFANLCLRYRPELPLVLRGVDLDVRGGEQVGICGRTGAGKSSLMVALFRICEFDSGTVFIDGVDIQTVKLRDLRRSLAIIPQDPVLYSGSLRENLDPFGEYADDAIWRVLQQVELAASVKKWDGGSGGGLDFVVAESGENLSVGQRQLLCIARALLKDSKVVVLDEATANVDSATDALIQQTIKETFARKTVLIIAHRIHTILHCDQIAVLDAGRVAEFGPPADLLSRPESIFAALAKRSVQ